MLCRVEEEAQAKKSKVDKSKGGRPRKNAGPPQPNDILMDLTRKTRSSAAKSQDIAKQLPVNAPTLFSECCNLMHCNAIYMSCLQVCAINYGS